MQNAKSIFKNIVLAVIFFSVPTIRVVAQDLLANQAPIDHKLRIIDSLSLKNLMSTEEADMAALGLYPDWDNSHVAQYNRELLPSEFKIDLRHFCMPTNSTKITSNYGYRRSFRRMHKGIDIKVYVGDTIRSAFAGKVRIVKNEGARKGYGKYVVIRHPNGLETVYGHLSKQIVKENQIVKAGEPIGLGGNTGRSSGSHLHFETRLLGLDINPAEMFDFEAQDVKGDYYLFRLNGNGLCLNACDGETRTDIAQRGEIEKWTQSDNQTDAENKSDSKYEQRKVQPQNNVKQTSGRVHKVKKGDTLGSIARKHNTSVNKLCALNHLKSSSTLRLGQILRVN